MSDQVGAATRPRVGRRSTRGRARARLRPLEAYLLLTPAAVFLLVLLALAGVSPLSGAAGTVDGEPQDVRL